MKIDVLSLFPEMYDGILNSSIIKRAIAKKLVTINVHNFRDYSLSPHKKVDDYPIMMIIRIHLVGMLLKHLIVTLF